MSDTEIYTGVWTDYSRSPGNQLTVTITTGSGAVLVAAIAIVVQITGAAIWAIVAFYLHQRYATKDLRDEFSAQESVILRNSGIVSAIVHTWDLRKWLKHAPQAPLRMLKLLALPLLIKVGFMAAAILSAKVAYDPTKSHVLIVPSNCGTMTSAAAPLEVIEDFAGFVMRARAYARDCYSLSLQDVDCSGTWAKSSLPYQVIHNVSCPLGPGSCSPGDDGAVTFWSMLDSYEDFGVNAPLQDRMRVGYNLTCAPIEHELIESFASTQPGSVTTLNNTRYDTQKYVFGGSSSYTFEYNNISTFRNAGSTNYRIEYLYVLSQPNTTSSKPDESLYAPFNRTGLDTCLVFVIPNAITYTSPSSDPIFGTSNESFTSTIRSPYNVTSYRPLHNVNGMACWQSYAFCNPQNSKCTDWVGLDTFEAPFTNTTQKYGDILDSLEMNSQQKAVAERLAGSQNMVNIPNVFLTGPQLLAMYNIVHEGLSWGLTENWWQLEVQFWFETILASMPISIQAYVNTNSTMAIPPPTPEGKIMCHQQLRRLATGYQNFSLLGLLIIFIFGILSIITAGTLRSWYYKLPKRKPGQANHHKALAWWQEGTLQLHRLALEGVGVDGWKEEEVKYEGGPVPTVHRASSRVPPLHGEVVEDRTGVQRTQPKKEILIAPELPHIKHIGPWGDQTHGWEKVTQYDVEDKTMNRSSSQDSEDTLR